MRRARPVALALALAVTGLIAASATGSPTAGGVRSWHGILIRPLDPPSAPAASAASASPRHGPDQVLSNETTFTRSAYSAQRAPIYARPLLRSARVARVHLYTEDGFPEVYLLLRSHWDAQGREWIQLRIPMRPNGHVGWVQRRALGSFMLTHKLLVVDRRRLRIYLVKRGRRYWSAPIAVGKRSTPTPAGHFWIRERFAIDDPRSGYYPYAFGTADYSTLTDWPGGGVIGIHGPYYQASQIPGRISHGCIRLRVRDDAWLAKHVRVGMPVHVE